MNAEPPSFVTKALQQTSVECTWDLGDEEVSGRNLSIFFVCMCFALTLTYLKLECRGGWMVRSSLHALVPPNTQTTTSHTPKKQRERKLTSYHKWHEMDDDDLGAYLASSSSESESEAEEGQGEEGKGKGGKGKGKGEERRKKLRSLLLGGLVGEEEEEEDGDGEEEEAKEFTYVPGELGKQKWERRVQARAAEEEAAAAVEGETPFEAMLRKRKEKLRARREARKNGGLEEGGDGEEEEEDDFFAEGTEAAAPAGAAGKGKKGTKQQEEGSDDEEAEEQRKKDAELELLFAGEDQQERARDFDMRALARAEKMKGKKLKGKRRRKEAERAGAAPGAEFSVDTRDPRFAAVGVGVGCIVCGVCVLMWLVGCLPIYLPLASLAQIPFCLHTPPTQSPKNSSSTGATRASGSTARRKSTRRRRG
jgi:hypothetical protein